MFYVFGLGNPGVNYAQTRHNVGRAYLEQFDASGTLTWNKSKPANAVYAHTSIVGHSVEFVLPEPFMNKSGDTLAYYVQKHGARPDECIVLHDDIDLPIGDIKISKGRGDGGNNGIKSIIQRLGSKEFVRVRIGIAPRHWWTGEIKRPKAGLELERFVLQKFTRKERMQLAVVYPTINAALQVLVADGPEAAMNQFN